jgi:hypothetical protein
VHYAAPIVDFWQENCSPEGQPSGGRRVIKKNAGNARKKSSQTQNGMINFSFADISYQIDPSRRKVYHRWIEVETAKTCQIMGAWSQSRAQEKRAV